MTDQNTATLDFQPTQGAPQAQQPQLDFQPVSEKEGRKAEYIADNKGFKGDLKVGLGKLASEALFGIPEAIYNHSVSDEERELKDALVDDHTAANVVGSVAGGVGSLLIPGIGLGGRAAKAGLAAEAAVRGTEAGLVRTVASKAAGALAENAAIAAPRALVQATQDPQEAAEGFALATGLGLGATLGGRLVGQAAKTGAKFGKRVAEEAAKHVEESQTAINQLARGKLTDDMKDAVAAAGGRNKLNSFLTENKIFDIENNAPGAPLQRARDVSSRLAAEEGAATDPKIALQVARQRQVADNAVSFMEKAEEEAIKRGGDPLGSFISSDIGHAALHVALHAVDPTGIVGMATGYGAARSVKDAALGFAGKQFAQRVSVAQAQALKQTTSEFLDKAVTSLTRGTKGARYVAAPTQSLISSMIDEGDDSHSLLTAGAEQQDESPFMQASGADKLAPDYKQAFQTLHGKQKSYVMKIVPRDPRSSDPYTLSGIRWSPSRQDMRAFSRRLEVVKDPAAVINRFNDGTLGPEHIEALDSAWPSLSVSLRGAMQEAAADPSNTDLRRAIARRRSQWDMLMGTPPTQAQQQPPAPQPMESNGGEADGFRQSSVASQANQPSSLDRVTMGGDGT